MDKWKYADINEEVYHKTLSNGLNVYLIKKSGYTEKCAFFGTRFGSFQTGDYLVDDSGEKHLVVGGIAHFLEHRLFDYYKGNVMDLYDELGAYTNAFTSYNKTVYYFSTIDNFDECLTLLLDFPSVFEMSEEAVNKEKDIIVQELLMYKDMPDQKLFDKTINNLYFDHPIKFDVGGEPEEVRETTRDLLKLCHQTFYAPNNMNLVVAGDIDVEKTLELIENNQKSKHFVASKHEPKVIKEDYNKAVKDEEKVEESINKDKLMIAYKLKPFGEDRQKEQLCMEFICSLLFSSSTDFYDNLVKEGLANGIESEFISYKDVSSLIFSCDVNNEEKVKKLVKERVETALSLFNEEELENIKKSEVSFIIRSCNSCVNLAKYFALYLFEDANYLELIKIIKEITVEDLINVYNKYLKDAVSSICILKGENND